MAKGPFWFWQKPASWSSRIFFLGRPRKKTLCKRKKTHKGNPRVSLVNSFPTEGAAAPQTPFGFSIIGAEKIRECLRLRRHSLSVLRLRRILFRLQRSSCRAANFRSFAVTRHFCSAKVLVRGLRRGTEDFAAPQHLPAKRNFQRKFALRRFKTESLLLGREILLNRANWCCVR